VLEPAAILTRLDAIMRELNELRAAMAAANGADEAADEKSFGIEHPWRRPGARQHARHNLGAGS